MSIPTRIPAPTGTEGPWYGLPIDVAIDDYSAAAVRAPAVDPVTTEVVRLRCARTHDCRLCQSLRLEPALENGLDETLASKVDHYETSDLDERHKVALRLADAVIADPGLVGDALAQQLREHFTDEQVAELLHDIVKWSFQKVLVALRLDAPPRDGLSVLGFDAEGNPWIGDALEV